MSSYWDEFLRLQMRSLGVLDVFCTVFECATTSRSKFKFLSIFAILDFLFVDFDHSTIEMSTIFHLWVPNFFSKSIIIQLFQKQNVTVNSHYFVPYSHFGDFSQFPISISTCELIFICEYIVEYSTVPKISHRKVWNLSFLTHCRTHS